MAVDLETRERLGNPLDHVKLVGEAGCWEWEEKRDPSGYGRFGRFYAHRLYHSLYRDEEIPAGMHIDHLCRNRACVNPDHLEVVTPQENVLRGIGPAGKNARKTHCVKGHEFTPENTRIVPRSNGHTTRMCVECNRATQREIYRRRMETGNLPPSWEHRRKERAA